MAIESSAVLSSVDEDNLENRSISELVSILRTAFRVKDFDRVEEVLVAKEVKMKKEIEGMKKENEILQNRYEFLRLDILAYESNRTKTPESKVEPDKVEEPQGFEKWKETYESLKEKENEIQLLKELIVKVNEDREKKKSSLEGFEKMLEAVKKTQEDDRLTMEKLSLNNSELQSAMELLKKEKEEYEKTIEELNFKKSELESQMLVLKNSEEDGRKYIEDLKCQNSILELRQSNFDELTRRVSQVENVNENQSGTGRAIVEIISDDDHIPAEKLSQAGRNRKRKRGLLLNDCKNIMTSSRATADMLRQCAELDSKFKCSSSRMNYFKDDYFLSSDSDSDKYIQNRFGSSHLKSNDRGKRCSKKWKLEAEMCAAFAENDVLCMEAVCILYRQSNLIGKSYNAPSRYRGFDEADLLRGSTLALFLTSGDSNGTLRKSVMELKKFDVCGLVDCRRIAIQHLKQLFEIYKNGDDRFMFH